MPDYKKSFSEKYEFNHAKKRNSEYEASLDELEECVSDGTEASESVEFKELQMAIDMFLSELPEKKESYFYADTGFCSQ